MAAPGLQVRGVPTGRRIPEGFQAFIAVASNTTIGFWEVGVDAPGDQGGDPIDITTQHNVKYKQFFPRVLKQFDASNSKVAYDPDAVTTILSIMNTILAISWHYPDGSAETHWAWIRSFKREAMEVGKFPMADLVIEIADTDPTTLAEEGPVFSPAAGT